MTRGATETLVVATRNAAKGREMVAILSDLLGDGWALLTLADFDEFPEPEESGSTYGQNASIKAEAAARATGLTCVADDAGLEVDALGGEPGLHSKRFCGVGAPFAEKISRILERLAGLPPEARTARFRCAVAVASEGSLTRVFEAVREGLIAAAPRGSGGFGYDPVFLLPKEGATFAEMAPERKNALSHRGVALREAAAWLKRRGAPGR